MRKVTTICAATLVFWLAIPLAHAESFYVSPAGDDANDCSTAQMACRTATAAARKIPIGSHTLYIAPGHYPEMLTIAHHRSLLIYGPGIKADGTCGDPGLVTVDALDIEHHSTVWAYCFTIGRAKCRQMGILGAYSLAINGTHALAFEMTETCRIHILEKSWINGPIQGYARARGNSTFFIGGEVVNNVPGLSLAYFLQAVDSILDLTFASFSGHPASGLRYVLDRGAIIMPESGTNGMPGEGSHAINFSVCRPGC